MLNFDKFLNSRKFIESQIGEKLTYDEYKEILDEKAVDDMTTETGTGGFIFGVLGHLWVGGLTIPLGPIAIALGVAAAGAGIIAGAIALLRLRRKKNLKKEITKAAEEWKEVYKESMRVGIIDLREKLKDADKEKVDKIAKAYKNKVKLLNEKMRAIDREISDRIADMSRKGGKNDPELQAWKVQEFSRVKVEALEEMLKEDLDKDVEEVLEKAREDTSKKVKELSKLKFEFKKGKKVVLYYKDDEELEELKKLFDIEESKNESYEFSTQFNWNAYNSQFLFEAEEEQDDTKMKEVWGIVKYDSSGEGIKAYVKDNNLDDSMTWTLASDSEELKEIGVKEEDAKKWYNGSFIYTMSKEDAVKKMSELIDTMVVQQGKLIDAIEKEADKDESDNKKVAMDMSRLAYGLATIPVLKSQFSEVEIKNEENIKKNLLFSIDFSSDAEKVEKYDENNNLAKLIKAYINNDGDSDDMPDEIVSALKEFTEDAKASKEQTKEANKEIDNVKKRLDDFDYGSDDVEKACNALKDDFNSVSNSSKLYHDEDEDNSLDILDSVDEKYDDDKELSETETAKKALLLAALVGAKIKNDEGNKVSVVDHTTKSMKEEYPFDKMFIALGKSKPNTGSNTGRSLSKRVLEKLSEVIENAELDEDKFDKFKDAVNDTLEGAKKKLSGNEAASKIEKMLDNIDLDGDFEEVKSSIDKAIDKAKSKVFEEDEIIDYTTYLNEYGE